MAAAFDDHDWPQSSYFSTQGFGPLTRAQIAYPCYANCSLLGNKIQSKREEARSCPTRRHLNNSAGRMWRVDTGNYNSWADGGPAKNSSAFHPCRYIQRHVSYIDENLSVWPFRWSVGRYRRILGQHRVLWPCRKTSQYILTPGSRSEGRCKWSDLQKALMHRALIFLVCLGSISKACSSVSESPTKYRHTGRTWIKSLSGPGFHWFLIGYILTSEAQGCDIRAKQSQVWPTGLTRSPDTQSNDWLESARPEERYQCSFPPLRWN